MPAALHFWSAREIRACLVRCEGGWIAEYLVCMRRCGHINESTTSSLALTNSGLALYDATDFNKGPFEYTVKPLLQVRGRCVIAHC